MLITVVVVGVYIAIILLSIFIFERIKKTPQVFQNIEKLHDLRGKTVIVTGGNSGIGYHVSEQLAACGARIILACRDLVKANAAKSRIIEATDNPNIVVKRLNLTSFKSVRHFCADILSTEERIDILINNAGAICLGDHITEDGLQITWQTNYFAPFLLTNLVLERLIGCKGKIINVTGKFCADRASLIDINKYSPTLWGQTLSPNIVSDLVSYFNAKSALFESSYEFERRVGNKGVSVCNFAIGPNSSNFYRRVYLGLIALVYFWLHNLFPKPEVEAKKLVNFILCDSDVSKTNYVEDCLASALWDKSCELVCFP